MKPWLRFLFGAGLALLGAAVTRAQTLSPVGIAASPSSALPGDSVTYTITVNNSSTTTAFTGTASFTIVLTNLITGATFNAGPQTVSPTSGSIPFGAADATTNQVTPGSGTFTVTATVPTQTTESGTYRATVTMNSIVSGTGSIVTPSFSVSTSILTVTGKPDLQITALSYAAGTSYVGGSVIPMSLTYQNNASTNGTANVPYTPGINSLPTFVRIQVVLSTNPTFGDADDFQLTINDITSSNFGSSLTTDNNGNSALMADGSSHTFSWNQVLPGNYSGSYYVLAKIDSLNALTQNDPPALNVNGNNIWGGNTLNPSGTLINLLPSNFPTNYLASHKTSATTSATGYSDNPSISSDGRYVVFASDATDLVVGDTNAARDIFLFDSQTGLVRRISVSQQGAQGNGASNNPAISANGRYVAFESNANNLVLGDTNGFSDIFVVDTLTGLIVRASGANATGGQANNPSFRPAMSSDGRYVVFESTATNLTATATTVGISHVYLYDRQSTGAGSFDVSTTTKVIDADVTTPLTVAGNANAIQAKISSDGTMVAFASKATNLVAPATTASRQHVYVRATANVGTATSGIKQVSVVTTTAAEGDADSQTPSLSSNGRYVVFASLATNLVTAGSLGGADTNGVSDIFVYDTTQPVATPIVRRMSLTNGGAEGTDPSAAGFKLGSINPTISSDGRYVAFASLDSNLTGGDTNGQSQTNDSNNALDIFVRDRDVTASGTLDTGTTATTMVSVNPFGYQTNGLLGVPSTAASNIYPVISADGRFVAYPTDAENNSGLAFGATNLLPLDSNGLRDVFLFDRRTTATVTPSTPPTVTITNPGNGGTTLVNTAINVTASATTTIGVVASVQFFVDGTSLGTSTVFPYTQTWTPTAVGTYTLSAIVTDSFGNLGVSTNVTVTVNAAPSVGITAPIDASSIVVGTATTVGATAAASNPGAFISSVQFFANGASLGTVNAPASVVSFTPTVTWTPASTGTVSLTAVATDSIGTITTSPTVTVTITAAGGGGGGGGGGALSTPPTVSLNPNPPTVSSVNTPVTLTATAIASSGFTLTSVQYFANGVAIGSSSTFPYEVVWTPTAVGTYSITAVATDNVGTSATSAASTVTVSAGTAPAVAITYPAAGGSVGVNALTTITATASSSTGFVASVQFFVNGVSLGIDSSFPYSMPWTPTGTGTYSLTVRATDNTGNFVTSAISLVTVAATTPPAVSLTSPSSGSAYTVGTNVNLAATASDTDGTITQVQFLVNGVALGTDNTSPYSLVWTPGSTGTYTVTAQATDDTGNVTTSTAATVTIGANAPPTVSLSSPSAGLSYALGNQVLVAAAANDSDGTVVSVQFLANGIVVGTATAAPFNISWRPTSAGNYSLTAVATDNAGNVTTSAALAVTITAAAAPTATIINPVGTQTYGVGNSIPITATTSGGNGPIAQVQFFVNGALVGTDTSSPYAASWLPQAPGTYSLLAVATDSAGISSNSTALAVTIVGNSSPSVALTSPSTSTSVSAGTPVNFTATATDVDGTVTSVSFLVNGNTVGSAAAAPFNVAWTPTAAGTYAVVAQAVDNSGNVTNSTATSVTVLANQSPSVSFAAPTNGSVVRAGSATTLSASANDSDGTIASVQYFANGVAIGSAVTTLTSGRYQAQWTPTSEGIYTITATAVDNSGAAKSTTLTVLATSASAGDSVYTGTGSPFDIGQDGQFAIVNIGGKTAAFIGFGSGKSYYYPGILVTGSGGFSLTDSAGRVLIAGSMNEAGATVTKLDGRSVLMIGIATYSAGSSYASGYYTGSLGGRAGSQLAAIVGTDGSIILYAVDGTTTSAGAGVVDSTGAFQNIAALGGGVFSGKADPATNFLSGTLTGPLAGSLIAAVESGVSFSDGFLRNLSSRGQVGAGANSLVAGFAVGGTSPKQVLIRAIGPSLTPFGILGALANPELKVFAGSATIGSNLDWGGAANLVTAANSVGAFPLSGSSLDAVVLLNLAPGLYTAQVTGTGGTSGLALVEFYDVDSPAPFSTQKVINISTRAVVGTGENQLIAGFVVNGTTAKKVLVRAAGPSLSQFGVPGVLADPVLRIIRNSDNYVVRENDNWEAGNDAALISAAAVKTGAFAFAAGSKDAAVLISLPPGGYSATVTGTGGTTGVALVEVYEVP
jgi:hypothetical protein